ncbi:efflux RND transporter periplasmic adaptor subunit [Aquabacterium sp. A7-Y]|uniref:efflux RND transporter periplasmic adaptor subunit n=1 Tax=Aquabacterium sp. A7-Y TaxID=1349605 RepID=UPI00223DFE6D|nr:efflux RND transporter periplasmic adaptor subunit [Aquabacterium sp. A7-Y]MCW7540379.1 efflux RND transporter periplasmic adaptor subunit [Aquabacterium sp. A7-Y]
MKKLHVTVAVIGLVLASAGAYWYQHRSPATALAAGEGAPRKGAAAAAPAGGGNGPTGGPVAVEVAQARSATLSEEAQAVGTLRSRQGVVLRPEVAGRIAALGFKDGERVRRGQLLVQLDATLVAAQVRQAEAQLSIARANDKRNRELLAENFVSQASVDQTAANLQVAEAQLALARAQLARTRILAPFDGTVGLRLVNVGDYVNAGADLVNVEDLRTIHVDFRLPERYLPQLQQGQAAAVTLDALPGRRFQARIEALDPQIDADGRSVLARASIANAEGVLRPGMFARVDIELSTRQGVVVVPEEALLPQGGKQYVIKAVQGRTTQGQAARVAQRVEVTTGARRKGQVEIVSGVAADETVVTAGHQRLQRDGAPLRIVQLGAEAHRPPASGGEPAPASGNAGGAEGGAGADASTPRVSLAPAPVAAR